MSSHPMWSRNRPAEKLRAGQDGWSGRHMRRPRGQQAGAPDPLLRQPYGPGPHRHQRRFAERCCRSAPTTLDEPAGAVVLSTVGGRSCVHVQRRCALRVGWRHRCSECWGWCRQRGSCAGGSGVVVERALPGGCRQAGSGAGGSGVVVRLGLGGVGSHDLKGDRKAAGAFSRAPRQRAAANARKITGIPIACPN